MTAADGLEVKRFARAIDDQIRQHVALMGRVEYGTVVTTSPLTVLIDGSQTPGPAHRDSSYTPTSGDRVYVHIIRNQYLVAGEVV